jgi:hypothetical protein
MNRSKCSNCGLVNVTADEDCRRCGASLKRGVPAEADTVEAQPQKRGLGRRLSWILGTTLLVLFVFYLSLLVTSDDLGFDRRQTVQRAVGILSQNGFSREAFILSHLTSYRTTDNWWNNYLGHHEAYAATNFPFEVVTLYPEFFDLTADDNERAAILLHESYHLLGSGEEAALEGVWREKQRIGWTADKYGETRVWKNTKELTMVRAPHLFSCGSDGKTDCLP